MRALRLLSVGDKPRHLRSINKNAVVALCKLNGIVVERAVGYHHGLIAVVCVETRDNLADGVHFDGVIDSAGGLGHVAYVTAVDPVTGEWTISEMNVKGLDVVDIRVMPSGAAAEYSFIHDKQ